MSMGITRVADQYGYLAQASAHREQIAGYAEEAEQIAARHGGHGITAGMNDPRRRAREAAVLRTAMPAPRGTDPDFTPRQEGGEHGDIYHGDGDWFSDYGQEPDAEDRARWQELTRQRDESIDSYIQNTGLDPYVPEWQAREERAEREGSYHQGAGLTDPNSTGSGLDTPGMYGGDGYSMDAAGAGIGGPMTGEMPQPALPGASPITPVAAYDWDKISMQRQSAPLDNDIDEEGDFGGGGFGDGVDHLDEEW